MSATAQRLRDDLVKTGLTPAAAVGVVGNLVVESGLDARAVGDGGLARGWAQWHPDRWNPLVAQVRAAGLDPYSYAGQERMLVTEMRQNGTWSALSGVTSVLQAATIFMRRFERPADQSASAARRRADAGLGAVQGSSPGSGSVIDNLKSGVGGLLSLPGGVVSGIEQLGGAASSVGQIFERLLWWFNPGHILRVIVGSVGALFIIGGIVLLTREVVQ